MFKLTANFTCVIHIDTGLFCKHNEMDLDLLLWTCSSDWWVQVQTTKNQPCLLAWLCSMVLMIHDCRQLNLVLNCCIFMCLGVPELSTPSSLQNKLLNSPCYSGITLQYFSVCYGFDGDDCISVLYHNICSHFVHNLGMLSSH